MMHKIEAYPGCPTLTWMIANRVTNKREVADAFITFTGRKGAGKSEASISFAEGVAEDIARLRGKGEPVEQFFNLDHIKSISEMGAIDLLTSGILKKENSVILLDDTGTQWGARNFQTMINKYLNMILQIARVYQCVIISNFIMKNHIDVQARDMTDFRAEMQYKDVTTEQAFFKFFYIEQGDKGEYKKYLTWKGKRIKLWVVERPSVPLREAYKIMRRENTDTFIEEAQIKLKEKYYKEKKPDGRIKDYLNHPIVVANKDEVMKLTGDGMKEMQIAKAVGITRYWVQKIQGLDKQKTIARNGDEE
jgi:hypothetical protein